MATQSWRIFTRILLGTLMVVVLTTEPSLWARPRTKKVVQPDPQPAAMDEKPIREFSDDIERVFSLRNMGQLEVTNLRGAIQMQGWALDKIRVKAHRRVLATTPEEAKKLLGALDLRFRTTGDDVELSAEYGRGLNIEERLKERKDPRTAMDIIVSAPSQLRLRIWAATDTVGLKSWVAPLEVRTSKGPITVEDIRADRVSLLCPECDLRARSIRGSLRCMGGTGKVDISDIDGKEIYVETTTGKQTISRVKGEQLYVTKEGPITGRSLNGRIEFHSESGAIDIRNSSGFASGRAETGDIYLQMRNWEFMDKALVESVKGNIDVALPSLFAGEVDLWSVSGKATMEFKLQELQQSEKTFGPDPINHLRGKVNDGTEQFRIFSQFGNVRLTKTSSNAGI